MLNSAQHDLEKAEEQRLKKRAQRMREQGDDTGDVTYINIKVCFCACGIVLHILTLHRISSLTTNSNDSTTNIRPILETALKEARPYELVWHWITSEA